MYNFQPLGENSIRLLQIQPAPRNGHISCILNQYNDNIPPYDALSYCWGDPKPTRKIYVNDILVDIHEALWEFLDQIQRSQETENWIWTDFLCLNQENHTEMGHQRLLRWTDFTELMLETHHYAADLYRDAPLQNIHRTTGPEFWNDLVFMTNRVLNILSLPYWTRAWIVQEVALAKQVILMFGGHRLDLNDFILAYKSYCYYISKTHGSRRVGLPVPIEAREAIHEKNASFQQILQWGQHCEASKTLDRIYGLLGLLERSSDDTEKLPYILTQAIDYTRDWTEIYWEIALTYQPLIESTIISGQRDREIITRWVDFLPGLGESFSCPFTRESLQYADNERAAPFCRNMARLALFVSDTCSETIITDVRIRIQPQDSMHPKICTPSWPTKPGARDFSLSPPSHLKSSTAPKGYRYADQNPGLSAVLATVCIETAGIRDMKENDKYQAAFIGLKMFRPGGRNGGWNCTPHQSMEGTLERKVKVSFDCEIQGGRTLHYLHSV
ncbi:Heterokaryon incompatibility protein 6 [Diaporthe eres]|nr:Heterokaryon incompatibility protein 6 [Diaporthe eres]